MMNIPISDSSRHRELYMVLSPRSLTYASCALKALLENSTESLHLHLITDSIADRDVLATTMITLRPQPQHRWRVIAEKELLDAEAGVFSGLPHLRAFRHGHPCWRKVTDPLLLSAAGAEMILLDPDLYFPNRFRFEGTPAKGLALMWQRPNCLLPPQVVKAAFEAGIPLARHVDIGVSHWRAGGDLEWLNWLIGRLGGASLPRVMHVEAIVWSAIAMREGGGYLDPSRWVCWHRTQGKRARLKLGAGGGSILASEPWSAMKCFHAGGEAKWWLPEFIADRSEKPAQVSDDVAPLSPFIELTLRRFHFEQQAKELLRGLGYHRFFGARA
jgi:hypothetical protein